MWSLSGYFYSFLPLSWSCRGGFSLSKCMIEDELKFHTKFFLFLLFRTRRNLISIISHSILVKILYSQTVRLRSSRTRARAVEAAAETLRSVT